jgi:hypothetical protein|tara:strand:- start:123 stop:275 length:153 start_codon:yes stop_codon:yes gene_type:complete
MDLIPRVNIGLLVVVLGVFPLLHTHPQMEPHLQVVVVIGQRQVVQRIQIK